MFVRTYKNGNATIRREESDNVRTLEDLVELVVGCRAFGFAYAPNARTDHGGYTRRPIVTRRDGRVHVYCIDANDLVRFWSGRTVRLRDDGTEVAFNVPINYAAGPFTLDDGSKGSLYALCSEELDDSAREELRNARICGCKLFKIEGVPVPESRRLALFVPYGIPHGLTTYRQGYRF